MAKSIVKKVQSEYKDLIKYTPEMQNILFGKEIVLEKEVLEDYTGIVMNVIYFTWIYKTNEGKDIVMLVGWVDAASDFDCPREVSCSAHSLSDIAAVIVAL